MKKIHFLTSFVALSLLFTACEKEPIEALEEPFQENFSLVKPGNERYDARLEQFARTLAASLKDSDVREMIKAEASLKFDGDYNILYHNLKEKAFKGGKFSQALATSYKNGEAGLTLANALVQLNNLSQAVPLLNISVPVNIDKWDTKHYVPLVVVLPNDFNEHTTKKVKAFTAEGKEVWVDIAQKPKNRPFVVVGLNERVEVDTSGKFSLKYFITKKDKTNKPGVASSSSTNDCTSLTCSSILLNGSEMFIEWLSFGNIETYESWLLGDPEVMLVVRDPSGYLNSTQFFTKNRSESKGMYFDRLLFYWNTQAYKGPVTTYSESLGFFWYEEDGGTPGVRFYPISYQWQQVNLTYPCKSNDDIIGYRAMSLGDRPVGSSGFSFHSLSENKRFEFKLYSRMYDGAPR